jgi:hypothetical protein
MAAIVGDGGRLRQPTASRARPRRLALADRMERVEDGFGPFHL